MTKSLEEKLKKCGFDLFIEAPVANDEIENIFVNLEERNV